VGFLEVSHNKRRIFTVMEKTLDLIGIGECLIEFNALGTGDDAGLYQLGYSGDVLNALSCAGRLGLRTGLISAIGDDPFSEGLREVLISEGIDLTRVPIVEGKPNGVYFVHVDEFGSPSFHFLRKDSAATETFAIQPTSELIHYAKSSRALLFSSIPMAIMKERDKIFDLIRDVQSETAICYDLNIRKSLWNSPSDLIPILDCLAPLVKVLFVSEEDDTFIFGPRLAEIALRDYQARGYSHIVFRRGSEPTLVNYHGDLFEVPVPRVTNIIDTTGAGDAFNAGFIAAMLRGHPPYECTAMGNAAAACSITSRGGRGSAITIERVQRLYRPLIKWGAFYGPSHR
jgi:2-dehydro-3-deoxygluconokinase